MGALSKIREAGFAVSLAGDSFEISPASALTPNQREFLKQHRAEIITELRAETSSLSATDRQKLLDYMTAIDERDPEMIDELLTECGRNAEALAWALSWADKVLAGRHQPQPATITCKSCGHFQSFNDHGGGAGSCAAGAQPFGACWWADTVHQCDEYRALETEKSRGVTDGG